jgi:hypothetical protein
VYAACAALEDTAVHGWELTDGGRCAPAGVVSPCAVVMHIVFSETYGAPSLWFSERA